MQGIPRWWIGIGLASGLCALVLVRPGRGERSAPAPPHDGTAELQDVFNEFPETDSPEVVRMYLAWKLAERLGGDGGVDVQLARFARLYRQIRRLTR